MTTAAARYLDDLELRAREARRRYEEMAQALERYRESIPRVGVFGQPPKRTPMQTRMMHHLVRRLHHLELLQGRLLDDHYLASKGMALEGICPVCGRVDPPRGYPGCRHMEES